MKIILRDLLYPNHDAILIDGFRDLHIKNNIEGLSSLKPSGTIIIHGKSRQTITAALLNNYPLKLVMWGTGLTVLVEAPKRAFKTLKALQELEKPIRRDDEFYKLLENPTLENVERFVAVHRLMEE